MNKLKYLIIFLLSLNFLFAKNLQKVSIQLPWMYQFQFAGYIIAKEKGYYEEAGLYVDIREIDFDLPPRKAVLGKKADFGIANSQVLLENLNNNADITYLFAMAQATPLILTSIKKNGIEKLEDLKGKKFLKYADFDNEASIISMINSVGLKLSDLNFVKAKLDTLEEITDGTADFCIGYSTITPYVLKDMGFNPVVFHPKDYGYDFYGDLIFTTKEFEKNHPKTVKAFYEASLKGWEYAFANVGETIDIIKESYDSQKLNRDVLEFEAKEFKKLAFSAGIPFGDINPIKIEKIVNSFKLLGLTKSTRNNFEDFIYKANESNHSSKLTNNEKKFINDNLIFKIGVRKDLKAIDFIEKNGLHSGVSQDILDFISQNSGMRFVYVPLEEKDLQDALNKNKIDLYIKLNSDNPFFILKEEEILNDSINPSKQIKQIKYTGLSFQTNNPILTGVLNKISSELTSVQVNELHRKWVPKVIQKEFDWTIIWILFSLSSFIIIYLLFRNIKQKASEQDRLKELVDEKTIALQKQLDINDELLGNFKIFTANSIHQIRVPLTVINIYLEMIENQIDKDNYDEIKSALLTMDHIYNTLAYKVQRDYLEFKPSKIDASKIMKDNIDTFSVIAKVNDTSILSNIKDDIFMNINETEFNYLVDNNLSNAIKYGQKNKPIYVSFENNDNKVVLSIASFGDEIENKIAIFDRYSRESKNKQGHGIGLHMVSEVCEKYDIKIDLVYKNKQNIFKYTFKGLEK